MGRQWLFRLWLAWVGLPLGVLEPRAGSILLPVEVLGEDGTTVTRTLTLAPGQPGSVHSLWLQVHGIRYPEQASVQINGSAWIPLRNDTVTIAAPGKSYGGIGGGFATLQLTLPLRSGTLVAGPNTVRFRFNRSDGLSSGYRVLALNLLTRQGDKILPPADFAEDAPDAWLPPLGDPASIRAGKELWLHAPLVAGRPHSPPIQARCADCHAREGRDLKYFNFSNTSIIARSQFHGLTRLEGQQIASYIRSLQLPNPGRPWDPPYQPGPGLDSRPAAEWSAGAGLGWILDDDLDSLPYLLGADGKPATSAPSRWSTSAGDVRVMAGRIHPDVFRPDGDLDAREIPIAFQLPDWSQWLPRIHPKDAWGPDFARSEFAAMYDGMGDGEDAHRGGASLRSLLAAAEGHSGMRTVAPVFSRWSEARRAFLARHTKAKKAWSAELTQNVYSTQLWQLVKTWEMTQEFALDGRGRDLLGEMAGARAWGNTIPADAAPAAAHIPSGPAGVGGSALTNEYLTAAWYQLQIILSSGNHQHRDRTPLDWVYLVGQFRDLYLQSHRPEPVRLLVAVAKALQSTDPHLGPDNHSQGWRPDNNLDPRIMISPAWQPVFKPLPMDVRRALAESMLAAWMDKNLQYPMAAYLPIPAMQADYKPSDSYRGISGGRVWMAAQRFRAAGVSDEVVDRLRDWGIAYTDRAARLQYH